MKTIAEQIIAFNTALAFTGPLPEGITIMNPFRENNAALEASSAFYRKYYSDNAPRRLILGINPGRFGAGLTGVPFTDPKRLVEHCGITNYTGPVTHEPSSVFIYDMIQAYGGEQAFYKKFYITSICPLGFISRNNRGKEVNYNYYDNRQLYEAVQEFMVESLTAQLAFTITCDVCFCLGTGKNETHIRRLNDEHGFFQKIVALEHPRYIIQYKSKEKQRYIEKYLRAFNEER